MSNKDFDGIDELLARLDKEILHYVSEDCFYSCPASDECCNDQAGTDCDCLADTENALRKDAAAAIRRLRAALQEGQEQVVFINEHDLQKLTGKEGVFATVRGVKDITHALPLYAAPIAPNAAQSDAEVVKVPMEQIQRWADAIWHNDVEQAGREMRIMLVARPNAAGKETSDKTVVESVEDAARPSPAAPDDALDARRWRRYVETGWPKAYINPILSSVETEYWLQMINGHTFQFETANAAIDAAIAASKKEE